MNGTLLIHTTTKTGRMSEATHHKGLLPVGHLPQWMRKKLDNLLPGVLTYGEKKSLVFNSIYLLLPFLLPFLRPSFMTVNPFPWVGFLVCNIAPIHPAVESFCKLEVFSEMTYSQSKHGGMPD